MEHSATPPLTADDSGESDDHSSEGPLKEEEPSPAPAVTVRTPDPAFEEYLVRTRRPPTGNLEHLDWRDWSWSQLKAPVLCVPDFEEYDSDDSDEYPAPLIADNSNMGASAALSPKATAAETSI